MLKFGFGGKAKPKSFDYKPRYYDAAKEEMEERVKKFKNTEEEPFSEEKTAMILFNLDMKGIAVSRGSACQSGSVKPSHVLSEIVPEEDLKKPSLRISFSHLSTQEEVDLLIEALKGV